MLIAGGANRVPEAAAKPCNFTARCLDSTSPVDTGDGKSTLYTGEAASKWTVCRTVWACRRTAGHKRIA